MQMLSDPGRPVEGVQARPRNFFNIALAASVVLMTAGGRAEANYVVSGLSQGYAISTSLTLAGLSNANATVTTNPLSGTSPTPYNLSSTINAGVSLSAGAFNLPVFQTPEALLTINTGLLSTTASSSVDGASTNAMTSATTLINNLDLKVLNSLVPNFVTVGATTLTSAASVSGTYGAFTTNGTPTIAGLSIKVLGVDVTALVEASAGATVGIGTLAGLSIGINVTSTSGDGQATRGYTSDNILLHFSNVVTSQGLLNGDITIGHAQASMVASPLNAVPEPSSVAMTAVGLGLAVLAGRKARRSRVA